MKFRKVTTVHDAIQAAIEKRLWVKNEDRFDRAFGFREQREVAPEHRIVETRYSVITHPKNGSAIWSATLLDQLWEREE